MGWPNSWRSGYQPPLGVRRHVRVCRILRKGTGVRSCAADSCFGCCFSHRIEAKRSIEQGRGRVWRRSQRQLATTGAKRLETTGPANMAPVTMAFGASHGSRREASRILLTATVQASSGEGVEWRWLDLGDTPSDARDGKPREFRSPVPTAAAVGTENPTLSGLLKAASVRGMNRSCAGIARMSLRSTPLALSVEGGDMAGLQPTVRSRLPGA